MAEVAAEPAVEAPAAPAPAAPEEPAPKPSGPAYWKFPPSVKTGIDAVLDETKLSKDQLKILRDAFRAFDVELKGSISLDMIGVILDLLGHEINEEELDEVLDEFDEDGSGEIEFEEFVKLTARFVEPEEDPGRIRRELRDVFMLYDKEARGFLPIDEFKGILRELDEKIPEEELDAIVDEIDSDSSGTVDFDEFMAVMTGD